MKRIEAIIITSVVIAVFIFVGWKYLAFTFIGKAGASETSVACDAQDCPTATPTCTPSVMPTDEITPTATPGATLTPTQSVTPTPVITGNPGSSDHGDGRSDGRSDGLSSCPDCTKAPVIPLAPPVAGRG